MTLIEYLESELKRHDSGPYVIRKHLRAQLLAARLAQSGEACRARADKKHEKWFFRQ